MAWNWFSVEQDVRQRHAAARSHAEGERRAARARRAQDTRRGPAPGLRLLSRLGGALSAWGRRLRGRRDRQAPRLAPPRLVDPLPARMADPSDQTPELRGAA